jgi:NAD-dependent dihydropyrimidine dehydrogenase PreA subunit
VKREMNVDKWYRINYEKCIECGVVCASTVYETETTRPNVIHPEGCVLGGRGCGANCPTEAIEYAGDTGENIVSQCGVVAFAEVNTNGN